MLLTSALLSLHGASTIQIPFNLHVLSLPPAFVLSQDQTLMLIMSNLILSILKVFIGSLIYRHLIFTYILPTYPLFFFTISYNCSFQNLARKNLSSFYHLSRSLPVSGFIWHSFTDVNNFFQKISFFLKFFLSSPSSSCFYSLLPSELLPILSYLTAPRNVALITTIYYPLIYPCKKNHP